MSASKMQGVEPSALSSHPPIPQIPGLPLRTLGKEEQLQNKHAIPVCHRLC